MPDWRFVTQVSAPNTLGANLYTENGMWVDLDGADTIMLIPPGRVNGARSRIGWLTNMGWHYIFVAEEVHPITSQEAVT